RFRGLWKTLPAPIEGAARGAGAERVPRVSRRELRHAVESGRRLSREESLAALTDLPLLELGELAQAVRFRKNPEPRVTFVVDSNPNYTNVCTVDCTFCAFYRKPQAHAPAA